MYKELVEKNATMAVIGLGYVGLPIALEFAKKIQVIGFDINEERISMMRNNVDPSDELTPEQFQGCNIHFTSDVVDLKNVNFYIIAVPTPIDTHKNPDLYPLLSATRTVASVLKKGDYVVFESTVYPGCTEEDCIPILEDISGLKFKDDFKVGYSPERINPGDKEHTLKTVVKVVSGCCNESLNEIAKIYELVVNAGIHRAPSIKVAEAAKIIENTQRDLNIALMNELSVIFEKMGINTYDVLEAAGTKWNFLKFYPGLVGGHCIGVDPYYLTYKSAQLGYHAKVITSGRDINDSMPAHIVRQLIKKMISLGKEVNHIRVLIMGATFKENVTDIRNSKIANMVEEFKSFGVNVDVVDPLADPLEIKKEYGFDLVKAPHGKYDNIILAVSHDCYKNLEESYFSDLMNENGIFADLKGIYRNKFNNLIYTSL